MENYKIEYKRIFDKNHLKEIVAFLNTDGGNLLVGAKDDGTIVGVPKIDEEITRLTLLITNNILPNTGGLIILEHKTDGNNKYINISISRGVELPYYIKSKGKSTSGCYERIGTSAIGMDQSRIDKLEKERLGNHKISEMRSRNQNLKFSSLKIYYEGVNKELNESFEDNLEFKTSNGEYNLNALLLSNNNNLPVRFAIYDGLDKVEVKENENYGECCLIKATENVLNKLKLINKTFTKITGNARRSEIQLFNERAVREAFLNAVIHNDYS